MIIHKTKHVLLKDYTTELNTRDKWGRWHKHGNTFTNNQTAPGYTELQFGETQNKQWKALTLT